MSVKVASLYAEIGADTSKLDKGLKDAKSGLENTGKAAQKTGQSFEQFKTTALTTVAALAGFGVAAKQLYDLGRAGAQIEFTTAKFDRLAQSIGTTGDALLGNLKTATKGTLSDMELMASATDLVGLGLVKTSSDAVRLSTVVAGLGMNMNQLVLTLANKTTMRFDQLGVSVDGFDEKVKKLEQSGMDTNAAFTEAFLQQAEQQLAKVGNAADTTLGSFMKLEAQTKNLGDSLKVMAANLLGPAVDALAKSGEMADHYRDVLQDLNPELYKQYNTTGHLTGEMRALVDEHDRLSGMARFASQMLAAESDVIQNNTDIVKANADAVALRVEAEKAATAVNRENLSTIEQVANANQRYKEGIAEANAALADGKMTLEEHAAKVAELEAAYSSAGKKIIADMLLMKATADGVFTDQEMNTYIGQLEKLGIITADDVQAFENLQTQAAMMSPAFAGAAGKIDQLDAGLDLAGKQAKKTAPVMDGINQSMSSLAQEGAKEATGAVHNVTMALGEVNGASADAYIDIWVREHGHVPTALQGTQGHGSSVQIGGGASHHAKGGMLGGNWAVVGDSSSGWSPYAEVITPWGEVIPHGEAQAMKDAGLLEGATRAMFGLDDFIPSGVPAKPSSGLNIPSGSKVNSGSVKPSGGSTFVPGVTNTVTQATQAALNIPAASTAAAQAAYAYQQQQIAMGAQQTSILNEMNNNIKKLVGKTATATDIAKSSFEGASKFS